MKKLPIIGFLLFLVFVVFSYLVSVDLFDQLDFNATVKIQDRLKDSFIGPFSMFSVIGSAEISSFILFVTLLLYRELKSIFVLGFYVLMGLIEIFGKIFVEHQGPPILFLKTQLPISFPSNYIPHGFFAYPSGHSARAAFVSLVIIFLILISNKLNKELKYILVVFVLVFDFIMFLSRVYLGEHWTTDVVGGTFLGFSLALISTFFLLPKKSKNFKG